MNAQQPAPNQPHNNQNGQIFPIAAVALLGIAAMLLAAARLTQAFIAASYLADTAQYAAEAAARPDGAALAAGNPLINASRASDAAKAVIQQSLTQINYSRDDLQTILANVEIEIINPAGGSCLPFAAGGNCYYYPAAQVTLTHTFRLMGIPFQLTRTGVAVLMPRQNALIPPPQATPIALPTRQLIVTPSP